MSTLLVTASARYAGSNSRALGTKLATGLSEKLTLPLVTRDVARLPAVTEGFANATFVPADKRTAEQRQALEFSDEIVAEAQKAQVIVLATPVYNFGPAAGFKAWADHLARIGVTFEYNADGTPVGKLTGKRVYTVVAAAGVPEGAPHDALSPWLKAYMPFVGLGEDHTVIWQVAGAQDAVDKIDSILADATSAKS